DTNQLAKAVVDLATGEVVDEPPAGKDATAQAMGRKGGAARAKTLTAEERSSIARKAAKARWSR
ncbi:MAG: histone H1, partial [Pseudomonadota bacterium]